MLHRHLKPIKWSFASITLLTLTIISIGASASSLGDLARGLNVNKEQISVSGISSGAFMAHQFHVAHSEHIMGAGIIAGGPYHCAQGSILDAVTQCSVFVMLQCEKLGLDPSYCDKTHRAPKNNTEIKRMAQKSFDEAKKQEVLENISALKNLRKDKIYLFTGQYDAIVPTGVMDTVFDFYTDANKANVKTGNVEYNREFPARHTMVRDSFNIPPGDVVGACALPPAPSRPLEENSFIDDCQAIAQEYEERNSCICPPSASACPPSDKQEICEDLEDVDLAGSILKHIYGERAVQAERVAVEENEIQPFDQRQIFKEFSSIPRTALQLASMAREGYVFIPETCKEGKECKLHVAFHGCLQGGRTDDRIGHTGNLFSKYAGYNEWAKANDIVVLYPQVEGRSFPPPLNPQGCWDWWGQDYTHENYHTKRSTQIKAVAQMINVLVGGQEDLLDVSVQ